MIELIFVTCLSLSPQDCETRSLLYTDISPMACLMGAQPELAKWVNSHPGYSIQSWRCQAIRVGEHEI